MSKAEQADAFRIRMLIGPVKGRDDEVIEGLAEMIEDGILSFDPETQILSLNSQDGRPIRFVQIFKNGCFQRVGKQ